MRGPRENWVVLFQHSQRHSDLIFHRREFMINGGIWKSHEEGHSNCSLSHSSHLLRQATSIVLLYKLYVTWAKGVLRGCFFFFFPFLSILTNQMWQLGEKIRKNCHLTHSYLVCNWATFLTFLSNKSEVDKEAWTWKIGTSKVPLIIYFFYVKLYQWSS